MKNVSGSLNLTAERAEATDRRRRGAVQVPAEQRVPLPGWRAELRAAFGVVAGRLTTAVRGPARFPALYASDLVFCNLAWFAAAMIRLGFGGDAASMTIYWTILLAAPVLTAISAVVYPLSGLYGRDWRFASVVDHLQVLAAAVLASATFVLVVFVVWRLQDVPRSQVVMSTLFTALFLSAARITYRAEDLTSFGTASGSRAGAEARRIPILLFGARHGADHYLRALQRDRASDYWPVGLVDPEPSRAGLLLRGVPILGTPADFDTILAALDRRGCRPRHVVFTEPPTLFGERVTDGLIERIEQLGITVSRLAPATELRRPNHRTGFDLKPIELTDLLERPQIALDRAVVQRFVGGRRVLVTGAGGSIGSELVRQIAALEPSELIMIDSCEYNLYAIDLEMAERRSQVVCKACLCNVREAARVSEIFERHRPELVFHAAALKHVPMVELNPSEGVLTNVIGTRNVAEATRLCGALAMIQVSTDKAVNPTNVMGASKRLAELYCQALERSDATGPRFMTVRFGNVLGSSGSLVPLFRRQLERGGPLTVTHPEMRRFFMTIREAVELTLQTAALGLEQRLGSGGVFVLDMGEPIRIIDIARRMIRLAGYTPDVDIGIELVGLRPGEKLFEELFDESEARTDCGIPHVNCAIPDPVALPVLQVAFERLRKDAEAGLDDAVVSGLHDLIPGYRAPAAPKPETEEVGS